MSHKLKQSEEQLKQAKEKTKNSKAKEVLEEKLKYINKDIKK